MKNNSSKIKRLILPITIVVLIILSIIIVLVGNKKKIDNAAAPVDRTKTPVAVTVAKAQLKPLEINVQYPAITQPYEEASLYAQTSGMITYLNVALGQHVAKGQVLGKLDTRILQSNLKAAQVSLKSAQINRAKLLDDYNRAKDLYENKAGLKVNMLSAKNSYENAMTTEENARVQIQLMKEQIANANIISPVSGIISANNVKQGEYVSSTTAIAKISNISILKTTEYVDQELSYQLKMNQAAVISSPVFGNETFSGKIIYISPVADANHNYQVDLLVNNNATSKLKGGTDVQVSFNTLTKRAALIIPKSALCTDEKRPYVYVVENDKAKTKYVTIGAIKNDEIEVLSGLLAGEIVITGGQINLTNGSNININK
jgi:RND family efflux transporter MFP subunit